MVGLNNALLLHYLGDGYNIHVCALYSIIVMGHAMTFILV